MPELPDVTVYVERLSALCTGRRLLRARIGGPVLLRTVDPPLQAAEGRAIRGVRRLGKRIVFAFDDELFLVFHLMIAGRFRWRARGAPIPRKVGHAAFDFESGTLLLTEASSKKRATLHVVRGEDALAAHDPGGLEIFDADLAAFSARLRLENRTLKRALTDPRILSGIGNAYSDEILHAAKLSPVKLTHRLDEAEIARLFAASRETLARFTDRVRREVAEGFPEKVTAFRPDMAAHGRYREPCPVCGSPIQRIVHAENESNYCPTCQTGGRLLADRALSQLLKKDWPRTLEELEARMRDA
ncbi:MAG TPA: DNA-formamidopyrimidine glycosylase family protein [Myxococcota bacterium]|nr:DNA-formamidopyrimidine glycosylase family protein [Myxococcota bacterium]